MHKHQKVHSDLLQEKNNVQRRAARQRQHPMAMAIHKSIVVNDRTVLRPAI